MRNRICNNLHSFISRILTICTIISLSTSSAFASTVGQLNSNVSFDFMNIASFKASSNAYFSNVSASPEYMATSSLLGSFINTFGPWYSYRIQSGSSGTPSTYYETKDVNRHLQDISINQWYIDDDIRKLYDRYYTYSDGNASLLNQINTNTTNMYGSQSATNVHLAALRNEITNFSWESVSYSPSYYDNNRNQITPTNWSTLPNPTLLSFNITESLSSTAIYWVHVPISYSYSLKDFDVDIMFSQYSSTFEPVMKYSVTDMLGTDFYFIPSLQQSNGIFIRFSSPTGLQYTRSSIPVTLKRITSNNKDYYSILEIMLNNNMIDNQSKIIEAINNKQLEANVDVSINNTITDNDLTLNVDLPNNATNDTSNLLNKLKHLMLTGVATNQLLNALDDVELHAWYSQSNKAVIEAINNQYTSLYD